MPPGISVRGSSESAGLSAPSGGRRLSAGRKNLILVGAMFAVMVGIYVVKTSPVPGQSAPSSAVQAPDTYVPAILKSEAGAQVSSLDVFMRTNSNTGLFVEDPSKAGSRDMDNQAHEQLEQAQYPENAGPPEPAALARSGPLPTESGGRGPAFSRTESGRQARLLSQAGKLNSMQKSYSGSNLASSRSSQDAAWGGSAGASAGSAASLSGGVAGVLSVPSFEGPVSGVEPVVLEAAAQEDDSAPWKSMAVIAMALLLLSAVFSAIDSAAMPDVIGHILCGLAMALGVAAFALGVMIAAAYGQRMLGGIHMLGGGVAVTAGLMAMTRSSLGPVSSLWMSAIAGIIGLLGAMFMSPAGGHTQISGSPAARYVSAPAAVVGAVVPAGSAGYKDAVARPDQG